MMFIPDYIMDAMDIDDTKLLLHKAMTLCTYTHRELCEKDDANHHLIEALKSLDKAEEFKTEKEQMLDNIDFHITQLRNKYVDKSLHTRHNKIKEVEDDEIRKASKIDD